MSTNTLQADIEAALTAKTVAVVGLSANPARPSFEVAAYLQQVGYRVIPVNPGHAEILGERCYPSLLEIPEPVQLVDVFRRPDLTVPIAQDAVTIGAACLWLQLGVINEAAAQIARAAGLRVVMDRCTKVEHAKRQGL